MNRSFPFAVPLAALALLVLAPAPPAAAQVVVDVQGKMGRQLFLTYCASCHGKQGRGDGPVAEALKQPPSDLTRMAARRDGAFPAAEIAKFIDGRTEVPSHGSREMPVWGHRFRKDLGGDSVAEEIARGRIDVLIDYLRSIQVPAKDTAPPPDGK